MAIDNKTLALTVEEFAQQLKQLNDRTINFDDYREGQRYNAPVIITPTIKQAMRRRAQKNKLNRAGF